MKKHWIVLGIVLLLIGSLVLDKCGIGMCGGSWGGVVEGFSDDWRYTDIASQKNDDDPSTEKYPACNTCDPQYIGQKVGYEDVNGTKTACAMPDPMKSTKYTCDTTNNEFIFTCTECDDTQIGNEFSTGFTADNSEDSSAKCLMPAYEDTPYTCDGNKYVSIGPYVGDTNDAGVQSGYSENTLIHNTDKFPKGITIGTTMGYEQYPRCDVYSEKNSTNFGTDSYGNTCVKPNDALDGMAGEGDQKEIREGVMKNVFSRLWKFFVGDGHDGNGRVGTDTCTTCEDEHVGKVTGAGGCIMPDVTKSGPYKCENGKFVAADWIAKYNIDPTGGEPLPRCTVCHDAFVDQPIGIDNIDRVLLSAPELTTEVLGENGAKTTIGDKINEVNARGDIDDDEKQEEIRKIKKSAFTDARAYIKSKGLSKEQEDTDLAALYNQMYLNKNDSANFSDIWNARDAYTDSTPNNSKCSMPDISVSVHMGGKYRCENGKFKFTTPIIRHGNYEDHDTPYSTNTGANNAFNEMWNEDPTREAGFFMANRPGVPGATEDQGVTFGSSGETKIASTTAARVVPLKFCARCGHRLHGNKNYCSECGASMMSVQ
jgi:hypothetical protein